MGKSIQEITDLSLIKEYFKDKSTGFQQSIILEGSKSPREFLNCFLVYFSKSLWIQGYKRAIETLEPLKIIRYGAKQEGEDESISIYYPNDNYKSACYGR